MTRGEYLAAKQRWVAVLEAGVGGSPATSGARHVAGKSNTASDAWQVVRTGQAGAADLVVASHLSESQARAVAQLLDTTA